MLSDLFEVRQWVFLTLHDGGHTTESGPLKLLAPVKRVTELEQSAVVLGDLGD